MHRITLIPGDGTGPEITRAAVMVLEAAGEIDWMLKRRGRKPCKAQVKYYPKM